MFNFSNPFAQIKKKQRENHHHQFNQQWENQGNQGWGLPNNNNSQQNNPWGNLGFGNNLQGQQWVE